MLQRTYHWSRLAFLIRGPMEDAEQLLIMTQDLLRKLIDVVGIKVTQLEMEARTAGRKKIGIQTDTEKTSKFMTATSFHLGYWKLIIKALRDCLNLLPES